MNEIHKGIEVDGKKFSIVRMGAFDAIHFQLRVAELMTKHGVNQSGSMMEAAGKLFSMLNREDHDEILFSLLEKSRAQYEPGDGSEAIFLQTWGELDIIFDPSSIAGVYKVALECVRFSILPVAEGLKKNIGMDLTTSMPVNIAGLFKNMLTTFTRQSEQSSTSGE